MSGANSSPSPASSIASSYRRANSSSDAPSVCARREIGSSATARRISRTPSSCRPWVTQIGRIVQSGGREAWIELNGAKKFSLGSRPIPVVDEMDVSKRGVRARRVTRPAAPPSRRRFSPSAWRPVDARRNRKGPCRLRPGRRARRHNLDLSRLPDRSAGWPFSVPPLFPGSHGSGPGETVDGLPGRQAGRSPDAPAPGTSG